MAKEGDAKIDFNTNSVMDVSPNQKFLSCGRTVTTIVSIPEFELVKSWQWESGGKKNYGARSSILTNDLYIAGTYEGEIYIYNLHDLESPP